MADFTPGPWEVDSGGISSKNEFADVAYVCEGVIYSEYTSDSATLEIPNPANARLIAAAPELFEAAYALREAQKAYMDLRGTGASDQQKNERGKRVAEAAAVMDAALAKARGEA